MSIRSHPPAVPSAPHLFKLVSVHSSRDVNGRPIERGLCIKQTAPSEYLNLNILVDESRRSCDLTFKLSRTSY